MCVSHDVCDHRSGSQGRWTTGSRSVESEHIIETIIPLTIYNLRPTSVIVILGYISYSWKIWRELNLADCLKSWFGRFKFCGMRANNLAD